MVFLNLIKFHIVLCAITIICQKLGHTRMRELKIVCIVLAWNRTFFITIYGCFFLNSPLQRTKSVIFLPWMSINRSSSVFQNTRVIQLLRFWLIWTAFTRFFLFSGLLTQFTSVDPCFVHFQIPFEKIFFFCYG